ncbi:MAG: hypothetical protein ACI9EF_001680 [Pseudohongiellaceae bacterium]|jgi:uncharacterized protein YceH (UPF0502 family)
MGTIQPLQKAEARVFGVLIEKSMTTPDGYPISLNALVNGCNQKSNRDPVTHLDEQSVSEAVRDLRMNRLATEVSSRSSRVVKFGHNAEERLELDKPSVAILAELLLRGPQTPGELRGRVSRMSPIESLGSLDGLLSQLAARQMVVQLSPLPGSRAVRFMQLIAPELHDPGSAPTASQPAAPPAPSAPSAPADHSAASPPSSVPVSPAAAAPSIPAPGGDLAVRVAALEEQVESLTSLVAQLRRRMGPTDES